jgi:hypothetical protein
MPEQGRPGFFGGAVPLVLVAGLAGASGVVPGVATPARAWEEVVHREIAPGQAGVPLPITGAESAVDTAKTITLENGLFAPGDPVAGNLNIPPKTDHGGEVENAGDSTEG